LELSFFESDNNNNNSDNNPASVAVYTSQVPAGRAKFYEDIKRPSPAELNSVNLNTNNSGGA
jgi:hypothetical protein